jgi:Asp-tRNA(Asn)/Glu-tRNA(Gln) amidotransferase A subunit family amidase
VTEGLDGKRIGVLSSLTGYHEGVDAAFEEALLELAEGGAILVEDLAFDIPEDFWGKSYDVLLFEFKDGLNAYLGDLPDSGLSQLTLASLIEFNEENAETELKWFGQDIFEKAEAKGSLDDPAYVEARDFVQRTTREQIDALLEDHDLDLLVAPTGGPAWVIDRVTGDRFLGGSSSFPAIAGYPHITVPMGSVHGLPVGLSFIGTRLSEPRLIEAAHAYERRSTHLLRPELP